MATQDTLLAVATDSISILRVLGYHNEANILQNRINMIMGWKDEPRIN